MPPPVACSTFSLVVGAVPVAAFAGTTARGASDRGDPATLTEAIWSCGHGLASLLITHPHFKDRPHDELIAAAMDMTLNGLLRR